MMPALSVLALFIVGGYLVFMNFMGSIRADNIMQQIYCEVGMLGGMLIFSVGLLIMSIYFIVERFALSKEQIKLRKIAVNDEIRTRISPAAE